MSVYRRASGRWAVLVDVDRSSNGRRKRRTLGTYATRKEAERAERDALTARERGIDLLPRTTTLAEVAEKFLADVATRLEIRTVEGYRMLIERHMLPTLGAIPIAKLRPAHVSELYAQLLQGRPQKGLLSKCTVHHVHRVLHRLLGWAERMQLVERNVARVVEPPTPDPSEAKAITTDEVAAVLAAADGTRWQPLFILAFATGARRGELLALTWEDVDLTAARVTIRRALSQTKTAGIYLKPTKTKNVRVVGLSPFAVEAMRRVRVAQAAERLRAGAAYVDRGFVFADTLGGWLRPDDATKAYHAAAKRAGISSTRLHSARHTAATLMLGGGTDARTVAGVLGHSVASTTLNIYGHLIPSRATAAVDALGTELEAARSRRTATRD